jgi:tRNA-2-methylthio-N6-dimethylallyladenosine synthase
MLRIALQAGLQGGEFRKIMKRKTFHIITIGCQMNVSDSERIAGYLEGLGFVWTDKREKADVVITTTCGVRQSAEDRVYGIVPKIKKENTKVITVVTGCLAGRADVRKRLKDSVDIWLPINELAKLGKMLRKIVSRHPTSIIEVGCREPRLQELENYYLSDYLKINPKHESSIRAYAPIGNGCNNFCAYCVVPYARGREVYRSAGDIIKEVESLVERGYKEITLIAQNVNSYNFQFSIFNFQNFNFKIDSKFEIRNSKLYDDGRAVKIINFPILLRLVNAIPGNFWIRFATSHPKDMSDELIKTIAECEHVCHQIHLPAQAGDNKVLSRMNRKYTREHYLDLIRKIRQAMPDVAISTDVIVGFPGETKQQFKNTEKLFREAKFDMAYTAQYSPRPGTAAAKFKDDVPKAEKKRREEAILKILRKNARANNFSYLHKTVDVLVDGSAASAGSARDSSPQAGKNKNEYFGKSATGKTVKITGQTKGSSVGKVIPVRITEARDFGLTGRMVK